MKEITKRELRNILHDWQFLLQRSDTLREQAQSLCYSIIPSYSSTGGCSSGVVSSKVERYYIAKAKIEEELKTIEDKILRVTTAIGKANLSSKERSLIVSIMLGRSLSSFASERNIYKSHIYKIRDRAIAKIHKVIV